MITHTHKLKSALSQAEIINLVFEKRWELKSDKTGVWVQSGGEKHAVSYDIMWALIGKGVCERVGRDSSGVTQYKLIEK